MGVEKFDLVVQLNRMLYKLIEVFRRRGLAGEGCFEHHISAIGERGDVVVIVVVQDLCMSRKLEMVGGAVSITLAEVL